MDGHAIRLPASYTKAVLLTERFAVARIHAFFRTGTNGWFCDLNVGTVNAASQLAFDDRERTRALPTIASVASNRIEATEGSMKGSMKAALALIVIYIAAFMVATQGGSQNPVQASASGANTSATSKSMDPEKEADVRSLLQYVGAKEQLQSVASESAAQYREKLSASVKNVSDDSKRQELITVASGSFQKNFDQQRALQQIAAIYDKHFTDDEIKGLLDFYSSPLGQKFAAETPKIDKEIQAVQVSATSSATRESLLTLKSQNGDVDTPGVAGNRTKATPEVTLQDEMKEISQRP
jgi:uncharacterized protein